MRKIESSIVAAVLLLVLFFYLHPYSAHKFYVITLDDGTSFVGKIVGETHFWNDVSDSLIVKHVYFVRPADQRDPKKGMQVNDHGQDIYWPYEMFISKKHVRIVEPVNNDSPLGKAFSDAVK